jgi:transposase
LCGRTFVCYRRVMTFLASELPDNIPLLHQMLQHLGAELKKRDQHIVKLEHRVSGLLRHRFGPRSDRLNPNQLLLIAEEMLKPPEVVPPKKPTIAKKKRRGKHKGHGRRRLPADLPRKTIRYPVPLVDRTCQTCATPKVTIGDDKSVQLERVPAQLYVIEHVCEKLVCPICDDGVTTAEKPPQPIEKGLAGPGLLADVVVSKYEYHMPLNRLEKKYDREGFGIARSTMSDWMSSCAWALEPVFKVMRDSMLVKSTVIHTDDTPIPVQDRTRTKTKTGRLWIYVGDEKAPYTVFDYTESRRSDGPLEFLKDYTGYLQADAYAAYDCLYGDDRMKEVACWAHARRYFVDAQVSDPDRAVAAVGWVQLLYKIENEAKDLTHEARTAMRRDKAKPLLCSFGKWLEEQLKKLVPKSPMAKAINYTLSNWDALNRYCEDGRLDIDNNEAEREIRRIAVGRKNWMFAGSDRGGHTAGILYSICASASRHGLDPWLYIRDLLVRVAIDRMSDIEQLLPDKWTPLFESEQARQPMIMTPKPDAQSA